MLKYTSSTLCLLLSTLFCATACTQQPAPVELRGAEDFSHKSTVIAAATAPLPAVSASIDAPAYAPSTPISTESASTASIGKVTSGDLAPPSSRPVAVAQAAAAPVPVAPHRQAAAPYIWPVEGGHVAQKFGPAGKGRFNDGITIASADGEPVYAAAGGKVAFVGDQLKGFGHMVIMRHKNNMHTTYAHLARISVKSGQWVHQGDIIGYVGAITSSKPGLYFAMQNGSKAVDPQHYLPSSYAEK